MRTLSADTSVIGAGVAVIQGAGVAKHTGSVLAKIIGAGNEVIADFGNTHALSANAGIIGAGVSVILRAPWAEGAIAGQIIASVIGASFIIVANFRLRYALTAETIFGSAQIAFVRTYHRIIITSAIHTGIIGAWLVVAAIPFEMQAKPVDASVGSAGIVIIQNASKLINAGATVAEIIRAGDRIIANDRTIDTLTANADIVSARFIVIAGNGNCNTIPGSVA